MVSMKNMGFCPFFRVLLFAFKIHRERVPADISFPIKAVPKRSDRRETDFEIPFVRKEPSRRGLAHCLPSVWSALPREIRSLTLAKVFKERIQDFVLNKLIKEIISYNILIIFL